MVQWSFVTSRSSVQIRVSAPFPLFWEWAQLLARQRTANRTCVLGRLEIGDVSGDKRDVLQSVDLHGGVGDRLKRKGAVVLEPGDAFACAARSSLQVSQTTIDGRAVEVDQVLDSVRELRVVTYFAFEYAASGNTVKSRQRIEFNRQALARALARIKRETPTAAYSRDYS